VSYAHSWAQLESSYEPAIRDCHERKSPLPSN
jgi:hypothetical protein